MKRPDFRITCCKCGKPIPKTQDIYALDDEWQRRFPTMAGTLACRNCAIGTSWLCNDQKGIFPEGHVPAINMHGNEITSWCDSTHHILSHGTHVGVVQRYPRSALVQGAEEYLRWRAADTRWSGPELRAELQTLISEWDSRGQPGPA